MARKKAKSEEANWYDYPQYFDMVFRDETAAEVAFFEQAFKGYAKGPVKRLYEPGCGSGRLVVAMAAAGYDVHALDLSQASLDYLKRKLKRRGLHADLALGDMVTHRPPRKIDAAFCTFNTFRHLMDDKSAIGHLRSVAAALRKGGIYMLGFHILPMDTEEKCTERWRAAHAQTKVTTTLTVTDFNRRKRAEQVKILVTAKQPQKTVRCRTQFPLRLYTHPQFTKMLQQVPELELVAVHDFDYDIEVTRELDEDLTDALFILRKR